MNLCKTTHSCPDEQIRVQRPKPRESQSQRQRYRCLLSMLIIVIIVMMMIKIIKTKAFLSTDSVDVGLVPLQTVVTRGK
jgi:hypothetical protein